MSLRIEIENLLRNVPKGIKASQIASKLGKSRHAVNKCLYRNRDIFTIDDEYCWSMKDQQTVKDTSPTDFPIIDYDEIEEVEDILREVDL